MKTGACEEGCGSRLGLGGGLLCLSFLVPQLGCLAQQGEDGAQGDAPSRATSRVIAGNEVDVGEHPWMAQIFVPGYAQLCGGSILNENWVLTAAHCVEWLLAEDFTVRAGVHRSSAPDRAVQTRGVRRIILHPGYNGRVLKNDLALVELSSPLTFTSRVQPVALAGADALRVGDGSRLGHGLFTRVSQYVPWIRGYTG